MELLLPPLLAKRLRHELRRRGAREIGGILMGEDLGAERFRVIDVTVQSVPGDRACFTRNLDEHREQLRAFFDRTGRDYTRFNYLGEWHSHPSFTPLPSETDCQTMQSIVTDPRVGVLFAVLIIVRLNADGALDATATAFRPSRSPLAALLQMDPEVPTSLLATARRWARRLFQA